MSEIEGHIIYRLRDDDDVILPEVRNAEFIKDVSVTPCHVSYHDVGLFHSAQYLLQNGAPFEDIVSPNRLQTRSRGGCSNCLVDTVTKRLRERHNDETRVSSFGWRLEERFWVNRKMR